MPMGVFTKILSSLRKARAEGYQFTPIMMIFDIKVDLRRKTRPVIRGSVVDYYGNKVYASTMKLVSDRILITVAAENYLELMMGDIEN